MILIVSSFLTGCGYKTSPRPAAAAIPGDVGLVEARGYPDEVTLKWHVPLSNTDGSLVTDLSGFKVYRTAQKVGEECENCEEKKKMYANVDFQNPTNAVINKGEVLYADKGVTPGNIYSYHVGAYNLRGREGPESQVVTVVYDKLPPAPEGLRGGVRAGAVTLEWTAPAQTAEIEGYLVYRGITDKPGEMKVVGGTKKNETAYIDKDVEKEKTYYYLVRSFEVNRGVSLESSPSTVVKMSVPSVQWKPPENINTVATPDEIRIWWDKVKIPNEETRYNIYRREAGNMFIKINSKPLSDPWYDDRDVRKGVTYRYAVTAFPAGRPEEESRKAGSEAVKFRP